MVYYIIYLIDFLNYINCCKSNNHNYEFILNQDFQTINELSNSIKKIETELIEKKFDNIKINININSKLVDKTITSNTEFMVSNNPSSSLNTLYKISPHFKKSLL